MNLYRSCSQRFYSKEKKKKIKVYTISLSLFLSFLKIYTSVKRSLCRGWKRKKMVAQLSEAGKKEKKEEKKKKETKK